MSVKAIIVDDDIISTEILMSFIVNMQDIEVSAKCKNAVDAFDILMRKSIDLVFLDIEMPKLNGIEFIKTLKVNRSPRIVVITANCDYAVECFDLDVMDYILKPIFFERFLKAMNKFYRCSSMNSLVVNSKNDSFNAEKQNEFIYVKENKRIFKIYLKDILYIESEKNYCKIVTSIKTLVTNQPITFFEENLPSSNFLRIHRSFVVSISKISSFTSTDIEIDNTKEIPIGRNYKRSVMNGLKYLTEL